MVQHIAPFPPQGKNSISKREQYITTEYENGKPVFELCFGFNSKTEVQKFKADTTRQLNLKKKLRRLIMEDLRWLE